MDLFGRRVRIVEAPAGSAALATGLYAGSFAGLASGDCVEESTGADAGDQRGSVDTSQAGHGAQNTAVDPGAGSASSNWSGSDSAGSGSSWDSGSWSGADFGG